MKYIYIILIIVILYLLLRKYINKEIFTPKDNSNIIIFLISHDNSNTGAPLYLYNLQQFFIKNNINTEFLLLNKDDNRNLIIQNGRKINPNNIEKYILDKCSVDHGKRRRRGRNIKTELNSIPIIICNTVVTYEYLIKLSHLKLNMNWIIHE